jgi:hypothetical protein
MCVILLALGFCLEARIAAVLGIVGPSVHVPWFGEFVSGGLIATKLNGAAIVLDKARLVKSEQGFASLFLDSVIYISDMLIFVPVQPYDKRLLDRRLNLTPERLVATRPIERMVRHA